jgi:LPS sulfotransferase NodH
MPAGVARWDREVLPPQRLSLTQRFGGYLLEAAAFTRNPFPSAALEQRRFLIFGRGRSGSTLLVSLLNAHPKIACLGELMRFRLRFPRSYIGRELSRTRKPIAGFKLLSYQLRTVHGEPEGSPYLRQLAEAGWDIIYLKRRDLFRQALSNIYARKRGAFHSTDRKAQWTPAVHVAPRELFEWMRGSEKLGRYEASVLEGVPHLSLCYEDHLQTPEAQSATLHAVETRFGVATASPPAPTLRPVTPSRLERFVVNIEELRAAMRASEFAHFLESDPDAVASAPPSSAGG